MTLEEYLKTQKEKELEIIPKLETRKANEGDDTIWKDAIVVNKKDEEEDTYFAGKVGYWLPFLSLHTLTLSAIRLRMPHQSLAQKKEEKVFLEIDARFERPQRGGRGGRGGERGAERSRGRGRGGRGRGSNSNTGTTSLDVDDQTAFPSLG